MLKRQSSPSSNHPTNKMKNIIDILSWNANGIRNKLHDIQISIEQHHPSLILIQETHLKPKNPLNTRGYFAYRADRPDPSAGGGAAILALRSLPHIPLPPYIRPGLECARLLLTLKTPMVIGSIYLQPSQKIELSDLEQISEGKPFFLAGDFNSKHVDWGCRKSDAGGKAISKLLRTQNIALCSPNAPTTCYTDRRRSQSILDIGLYSDHIPPPRCFTLPALSSDHLPVLFNLDSVTLPAIPPKTTIHWDSFRQYINAALSPPPPPPTTIQEIDAQVHLLTESTQSATQLSSQSPPIQRSTPSIPHHIQALRTRRNKAYHRFKSTGNRSYKREYNSLQHQITAEWRTHTSLQWEKFTEQLDTRCPYNAFKIAKSFKSPASPPHPLKQNNTLLTNPQDITNALANHLEHIYAAAPTSPEDQRKIDETQQLLNSTPPTPLSPCTDAEVIAHIKHLKPRKAPGFDKINNAHLRHFSPPAIHFLTNLYNACLSLCYFPSAWKISKVITIPKPNKDLTDPKNHRPIHLLSAPSKILERLILTRLNSSIPPDSLPPEQMGFRKKHSTTDQLVRIANLATVNKAKGRDSLLVCLDIEQAFDSVWHEGLLLKLAHLSPNPPLICIIKSFLQNRTFHVVSKFASSSPRPSSAGVPQGSVLSPTLFSLYTHDIPSPPASPPSHLAIYADDVAVLSTLTRPSQPITGLNKYLNKLDNFYSTWKLKVHPHKTSAIHFTKKRNSNPPSLFIAGSPIQYTPNLKYLGVTFDQNLSFNQHLEITRRKTASALHSILPLLRSRSLLTRVKLHLVKACIWPIITYAAPAWSPIAKNSSSFQKISQLHKRSLHKAMSAQWFVSYATILHDLNLPPLSEIIHSLTTKYFLQASTHENPLILYAASKHPHHNDPLYLRVTQTLTERRRRRRKKTTPRSPLVHP